MALDDTLVKRGEGNVDVQVGGPGNNWAYLSNCAAMTGPTISLGEITRKFCKDGQRAGAYNVVAQFRGEPDPITFDLMTRLGKIDTLAGLNCPFSLRARYAKCGEGQDVGNFDPIMLAYCAAQLTEIGREDLVAMEPENDELILVTSPVQADSEYRTEKVSPGRIGTLATLGDQPINDITFCSQFSCGGVCGDRSDACSIWYGVTDADDAPYANPNIVKGVKDLDTGVYTITNNPVLGVNGALDSIVCAGDRLIVSSNADSVIAFNDNDTDQDTWNLVTLANAPSANPNALFAFSSTVIWVAANNGFVYKSIDGGTTFSESHPATLTAENLNAVWAHDADLVYATGDNGTIIKSTDGGTTWVNITEVATTSANILKVSVPPDRPKEVYIFTNDGQIFRSKNEGGTLVATGDFVAVPFTGNGVGTVDDASWCGPCGSNTLWILHNDAGPRARILRDHSGGAGGPDVEIVMDYTTLFPAGIDLNALDCCGVNGAIAAGENQGGFPVVVLVS